jgi:hypothetical protein
MWITQCYIDFIFYVCEWAWVEMCLAGDGPKRIDLEQMREKHMLHERVELVGPVKHSEVRNVRLTIFRIVDSF